jgi:Mn-dependent DtxR family transcriptional regulator
MTRCQTQVLQAVRDLSREGAKVTVRQIAARTGHKSPSSVHMALEALERRGLVDLGWAWGGRREAGAIRPLEAA